MSNTLMAMQQKGLVASDTHASLQQCLQSAQFQSFQQEHPLYKLTKSKPGETWSQSLLRHQEIVKIAISDPDEKCGYAIETEPKDTSETIAALEAILGVSLPSALKDLYLNHGAFSVGHDYACEGYRLESAAQLLEWLQSESAYDKAESLGLVEQICSGLGKEFRSMLEDEFSAKQIAYLDNNYKVIGRYFYGDGFSFYFYFDRRGNFGSVDYDKYKYGFPGLCEEVLKPLLQRSQACQTLNELVSEFSDRAIAALLKKQ